MRSLPTRSAVTVTTASGPGGDAPRTPRVGRPLVLVLVGALLSTVGLLALVSSPTVAGAAVTASTEVITHPGQLTPLGSGGSATTYGVALPSGASCPGDTAHEGYHVFSYLVPEGVSPTAVSFKTGDPSKYFGYIANGAYFGAVNTAEDTGAIVSLPDDFTWSRLTPQDLFAKGTTSATWEGGIACADVHGNVTDYWNSQMVFTASSSDGGGFTWRVVRNATPASSNLGLWVGVILAVLAVSFAVIAVVLGRRRRQPSAGPGRVDASPPVSR
jgi:hypothetical protein